MTETIFSRPELFWFLIGLGLFLLELVIPGFFIFFFGLGAWVTALVCLIGEPGINLQIIIFAITSVLSLIGLRRIIQKKFFYSKGNDSRKRLKMNLPEKKLLPFQILEVSKQGKLNSKEQPGKPNHHLK